ncbi:MAG: hypothetical protein ACK4VI_07625 [Alphaproteobacteria bacterium]
MNTDKPSLKTAWQERLRSEIETLQANGAALTSNDLYNKIVQVRENLRGEKIPDVSRSDFALEMAQLVSKGVVQAHFDGRTTVEYSTAPELQAA